MFRALKTIMISSLLLFGTAVFAADSSEKPVTIGVLVPVEVPAMKQILQGFETTLKKESKRPVHVIVKNAQGNINIQRSILQEFNSSSVDIVAPIGTDAAQMAIAMIRHKPIIGIAADNLKTEAKNANNLDVTGVLDEVDVVKQIAFMHAAMPALNAFTLVYSTDARIFNDVSKADQAAKEHDIKMQKMMVSELPDLYTIGQHISPQSKAIFILKDEMIVSGLNTLLQQANAKKIPVIASDDGSVAKGAAFALGVSENQIGVDSAKLALKIMSGVSAKNIPVQVMSHYFVFLNEKAAASQNVDVNMVKAAAKKLGYPVMNLVSEPRA